jgi:hypothetical protein
VIGGSAPEAGDLGVATGGRIYSSGGIVTLEPGSKIVGDSADNGGGGGISTSYGSETMRGSSRIYGNNADSNGGGINAFNGTILLESGSVLGHTDPNEGNWCGSTGGGIYGIGGTVTVASGSKVIGNAATNGGGIAVGHGTATVESGSQITGNVAMNDGGGVLALGTTVTSQSGVILCDNSPLNKPCSGSYGGSCPQPGTGVCL